MAMMYRSPSLLTSELLPLYGGNQDPYTSSDDHAQEENEMASAGPPRSISLNDYSMEREEPGHGLRQAYFSNQEYYWRLEELKRTHLRNMAELERMYIGRSKVPSEEEGRDSGLKREETYDSPSLRLENAGSMPIRTLQQIVSDEELDFNDTSSVSNQSESSRGNNHTELELVDKPKASKKNRNMGRDRQSNQAGTVITQKRSKSQVKVSSPKSQVKLLRQTQSHVGARSSRVTIPQPFQMTVREEEKKQRRVRTRSEVELENSLLRRELDELRECGRKFRATPAPSHTRRPLYEVVSHRPQQQLGHRTIISWNRGRGNRGGTHANRVAGGIRPTSSTLRPFSFLERERKKREQKILAGLGNLEPKEERRVFKARPMPKFVYSSTQRQEGKEQLTNTTKPGPRSFIFSTLLDEEPREEREDTEGNKDTSLDPELRFHHSHQEMQPQYKSYWRHPSIKMAALPLNQRELLLGMELERKRVKEREWSYIDPLQTAGFSVSHCTNKESSLANKSDYISV
ncbi:protein FAM161A-like [Osmerus eperlanus]|uniref:protein FAM161A-like n=1 Tax=Osmerus eperlanus TaxID=29151 RepID=UPI002E0FE3AE